MKALDKIKFKLRLIQLSYLNSKVKPIIPKLFKSGETWEVFESNKLTLKENIIICKLLIVLYKIHLIHVKYGPSVNTFNNFRSCYFDSGICLLLKNYFKYIFDKSNTEHFYIYKVDSLNIIATYYLFNNTDTVDARLKYVQLTLKMLKSNNQPKWYGIRKEFVNQTLELEKINKH
jgi:hypothetical protein